MDKWSLMRFPFETYLGWIVGIVTSLRHFPPTPSPFTPTYLPVVSGLERTSTLGPYWEIRDWPRGRRHRGCFILIISKLVNGFPLNYEWEIQVEKICYIHFDWINDLVAYICMDYDFHMWKTRVWKHLVVLLMSLSFMICQIFCEMTVFDTVPKKAFTLQWHHNWRDSVSNHQPHDCLLNRLFRRRSKKTSKPGVTGLCAGNSSGTGMVNSPHK